MPKIENREWQKTGSVRAVNRELGIGNRKKIQREGVQYLSSREVGEDSKGFTSIELIMVIICLSILTFAIGVRFKRSEIGSAVAADQLIADIRYVQLKAISIGVPYQVSLSRNSYTMSRTDGVETETKRLPGDESLSINGCGTPLRFNTLGEPNIPGDCTITLTGGSTIRVFAITGKAE